MDLIKELAPYKSQLDAYVKTKTMTDNAAKNALVKIWDRFINIPEHSKRAYGKETKVPITDMTCDDCKMKAIRKLVAWSKELANDVPKISMKMVKSEVKEVATNVVNTIDRTNIESVKAALDKAQVKYHWKAKLETLVKLLP
jgi:hypothetical protein